MFMRSFQLRQYASFAAALVLLASLPEVVCCCDISWGPGGLLGQAPCCQQAGEKTATGCCCRDKIPVPRETSGPVVRGTGSCPCLLSYHSPSPMHGESAAVAVDFDFAWTPLDIAPLLATDPFEDGACYLAENHRPPLTPLSRCALLETWLV